jgi:FkbM family methyltransferase
MGEHVKWRFIYRGLKARYRDQRQELRALTSALGEGDVAVDVGANKGSYLFSLSRAVPRGRVVAFEPQPLLAEYLTKACRAAGLSNVVVEAAGVSDKAGVLTLAIPGGKGTSPGASSEQAVMSRGPCSTIEVKTLTLDQYFAKETRRIGAMKIDVEGHELAVMRGAMQIISEHSPIVVCEWEARHMTKGNVATILDFFRDHSYDGFLVCGRKLLPASQFDPAVHQKQTGEKYWDAHGYFNNFIMQKQRV